MSQTKPEALLDLVRREALRPGVDADKIPWHEPDFSRRMLAEHLSQLHDGASRRFATIDRQVAWLHERVLERRPSRVLDLGCGPGFYTSRLAALGHECLGIDFSPASIAYAREQAQAEALRCSYRQQDIRNADLGREHDAAFLLFGELATFGREDAAALLCAVHAALCVGGAIVLETNTRDALRRQAQGPSSWYSAESGLFSDDPHLCLNERSWDEPRALALQRWYVIDASTAEVKRHAETLHAYDADEIRNLLEQAGFDSVQEHAALDGGAGGDEELRVQVARKPR